MDGENNGKPYEQMGDLGGVFPLFLEFHPNGKQNSKFGSKFGWFISHLSGFQGFQGVKQLTLGTPRVTCGSKQRSPLKNLDSFFFSNLNDVPSLKLT